MPRSKKTMSGAPASAARPVTGQEYGKGVQQEQLQAAMPAPRGGTPTTQLAAAAAQNATQQRQAQAGQPQQGMQQQSPSDLMALASQMRDSTGLLGRPTDRPAEPVTAGLPSGAGVGPEALGTKFRNPLGDTLRNLARVSGDPYYAQLAERSRI